jgi:hypothetical protein
MFQREAMLALGIGIAEHSLAQVFQARGPQTSQKLTISEIWNKFSFFQSFLSSFRPAYAFSLLNCRPWSIFSMEI